MDTTRLDPYRQEMITKIAARFEGEHFIETAIDALNFYYREEPTQMLATVYEPSLCIIVQGAKTVGIGEEQRDYDPESYLLASIHMPASVRISEASKELPYMGLTVKFSMEQIFEVLKELGAGSRRPLTAKRGLYFGEMDVLLLDPVVRLIRLLDRPGDIPVLAPLITKEILYHVMRGEGGDLIRQYVMDGSSTQQVVKAITKIKEEFKEALSVGELARAVGMSESSLYHNFKKLTAMSPLQFQKHLRLHEARQMLMAQNIEAAQVAFEVGYESPSQFSREYARMFGLPPKADARQMVSDHRPHAFE